jgi:Uma2 family endonuclease
MSSAATLHPALPQLGRPMTVEEWAAMDEDEPGELVDGRLEDEEVPDPIHEIIVIWLGQIMRTWLGLSTPFAKFAHRSNLGGDIRAGGWV